MQTFIKILASLTLTAFLLGCAHAPTSQEPPQTTTSYEWHDGAKGGTYGIGKGWSIEILPPEYEIMTETVTVRKENLGLIVIPAEYKWIKDDSEDLSGEPVMIPTLITLPAEYETVTETVVVEAAKTKYYLTDAAYNSQGGIITPKSVERWVIPAVIRDIERRIMKTPERTVERIVPLERRKGYRRVIKTPVRTTENPAPLVEKHARIKMVETKSWRFIIKNPHGQITHSFDDFKDLTVFTNALQ